MFGSPRIYGAVAVVAVLLAVVLTVPGGSDSGPAVNGEKAVVFMSSGCSCCGYYARHLERETDLAVERSVQRDMQNIKEKYNVPERLQSCHTAVIGDYVVEGHIPAEAVEKLLRQKPLVTGIALPGMPSGSPGMPGQKTSEFTIRSFDDRGISVFEVV